MPRDSSGNYTLPAGNPVVAGTIIEDVWANTTMQDIALQLNNVFTRDGLLGPTDSFLIADGSVGAPGLGFTTEFSLGLHRPGLSTLAVVANNVELARFTLDGTTIRDSLNTGTINASGDILTSGTIGTESQFGFSHPDAGDPIKPGILSMFDDGTISLFAPSLTVDRARGIAIAPNGYLTDLYTGYQITTRPNTSAGYLPLEGGTITGILNEVLSAWPSYRLEATGNPTNRKKGYLELGNDGSLHLGVVKDTGGYNVGISLGADNIVRDTVSGGTFWHSANDGISSGLDADLLRGNVLSTSATGWTVAQRNGNGDLICSAIYAGTWGLSGPSGGVVRSYGNDHSYMFRWSGASTYARIDDSFERMLISPEDLPYVKAVPGYLELPNGFIMQWGAGYVAIDSYTVFNLPRAWSVGLGGWACPNEDVNMVGSSVIGPNIRWISATQIAVGIGDQGWSGSVWVKWFAIGY